MPIVDLSFPIRPHFRWKVAPEQVATHAEGDPLQSTVVTISCHAYTHVDAPLHFLREGRDIATMPVAQWIGDAATSCCSEPTGHGRPVCTPRVSGRRAPSLGRPAASGSSPAV